MYRYYFVQRCESHVSMNEWDLQADNHCLKTILNLQEAFRFSEVIRSSILIIKSSIIKIGLTVRIRSTKFLSNTIPIPMGDA